jgi:hypothetical protein
VRDHAEPELPDFEDEAIDLALVHADDEYLDLLGGAKLDDRDGILGEFGDAQLTELLMTWRRDVDAEPMGDLVDQKLATVTVHAARMRKKRRPRMLVPIAAAAAVLAIAFAGVGLAARGAQPGDTLWALTKVLYAEHARSVEAAQAVKADLREAQVALTEGNVAEAKSKLEDAHAALPTVSSEDGKTDLEAQHASLVAQLPGNPSGEAGPPPSPEPTTQPDTGTDGSSGGGSSDPTPPDSSPDESSSSPPPEETTDPSTAPTTSEPPRSEEGTGTTGGTEGAGSVGGIPAADPAAAPAGES